MVFETNPAAERRRSGKKVVILVFMPELWLDRSFSVHPRLKFDCWRAKHYKGLGIKPSSLSVLLHVVVIEVMIKKNSNFSWCRIKQWIMGQVKRDRIWVNLFIYLFVCEFVTVLDIQYGYFDCVPNTSLSHTAGLTNKHYNLIKILHPVSFNAHSSLLGRQFNVFVSKWA